MSGNGGIFVGGSNSGNINTGDGNVTQTVQVVGDPQAASTLERIDQLLVALLTGAGQLPAESAEVVTEEAEWLRDEVKSGQLHARHVRHALDVIAKAAAPVVPLLNAVNEVTDLILKLLH
jgi:hypothetical protein